MKNIQAYIKTFCIIIPIILLKIKIQSYIKTLITLDLTPLILLTVLILIWKLKILQCFILGYIIFFFISYYINVFRNVNYKNKTVSYNSLFKDKEFIFSKDSLFKFYYSSIIILFIFLIKNNSLSYFLELNIYFIGKGGYH